MYLFLKECLNLNKVEYFEKMKDMFDISLF